MSWQGGWTPKVPHGIGVRPRDVQQNILAETGLE
jgi:hypothetical protein